MDCEFLAKTILFQGTSPQEVEAMLGCLQGEVKKYKRGEIVYHMGEHIHAMGLVLSGSVSVEHDDVWGNKSVLDKVGTGRVFAETYSCMPEEPLMLNIVATEATEILFLNMHRVMNLCSNACTFHRKMIHNLLSVLLQKNLRLSSRIFHTSSKSIRGRLLSYLSFEARQKESNDFEIPFNRQQLADYLNVDRSALSNELSKMQKEGLLKMEKNHFILLGIDAEVF